MKTTSSSSSSSSSSYKKYNDKKLQEISLLENELISSKKWDMKGEVKGQVCCFFNYHLIDNYNYCYYYDLLLFIYS
jgi:hypothetical protein